MTDSTLVELGKKLMESDSPLIVTVGVVIIAAIAGLAMYRKLKGAQK